MRLFKTPDHDSPSWQQSEACRPADMGWFPVRKNRQNANKLFRNNSKQKASSFIVHIAFLDRLSITPPIKNNQNYHNYSLKTNRSSSSFVYRGCSFLGHGVKPTQTILMTLYTRNKRAQAARPGWTNKNKQSYYCFYKRAIISKEKGRLSSYYYINKTACAPKIACLVIK